MTSSDPSIAVLLTEVLIEIEPTVIGIAFLVISLRRIDVPK